MLKAAFYYDGIKVVCHHGYVKKAFEFEAPGAGEETLLVNLDSETLEKMKETLPTENPTLSVAWRYHAAGLKEDGSLCQGNA